MVVQHGVLYRALNHMNVLCYENLNAAELDTLFAIGSHTHRVLSMMSFPSWSTAVGINNFSNETACSKPFLED
jgi:hypothetical protein